MGSSGVTGAVRAGVIAMSAALAITVAPGTSAGAEPIAADSTRSGSARTQYRSVDLGTLGGQSSVARAMNDRGTVVGRAQVADGTWHGFVWRCGRMTDLGLFTPHDINNRGQVVGTRDDLSGSYLWWRGAMTAIGSEMRYPSAINDRAQVVGSQSLEFGQDVPVLWSRGRLTRLPLDSASDINDRGVVSGGRATADGGFHASTWRRGRVRDLGAAAFNRSNSYRINDRGWVIGWTFSADQFERGALWRHGKRLDLGTLGGKLTRTVAINDRGAILATSQVRDGNLHPALWRRGKLTDLSTVGLNPDADLADLNDGGEIAASYRPVFGTARAVVYRPIPHRKS